VSKTANSLSDNWIQTSIFLFAFGLYANTLLNGYALDDHLVTTSAHPQISKGLEAIPEIFATHYVSWNDYNVDYRPLVKAIFAIEYQLFGESPKVGHLINVLLYGLTCVLLFQVLIKLFPDCLLHTRSIQR
jgi:4-amino-4-deoxy-L-arabinose transferase-like glycosyltransferase